MTHIVLNDPDGTAIADFILSSDGSVDGMVKDGYDLLIDGEELESTTAKS